MNDKLKRIKEYIGRFKDEKGQGIIFLVIEILIALYVCIVIIKYLIWPVLFGN